ncbi:hypothetical protein LCGC14_0345420 [marine sediment metagenome]|uniref:Uncharacterized protein n=1 Tax=marine sediment metagenome TaxID=412755 RepID=A0A0F9VZT8_9ZZZZ|nr:hypothetical protein [Maribacter sp.]HDZ04705.1 hypothetical protein [Maribacter sp.]
MKFKIFKIVLLIVFSLMQGHISAQENMGNIHVPFGDIFTLSSNNKSSTIGNNEENVNIELLDYMEEWGYDAPPEDENRNHYSDVQYTLQVKVKGIENTYSFYSSEIKQNDNFTIALDNYTLLILSDDYANTSASIEMKVNKKDKE